MWNSLKFDTVNGVEARTSSASGNILQWWGSSEVYLLLSYHRNSGAFSFFNFIIHWIVFYTYYIDSNEILFLMKFCWKRRNYQKEHWNCLLCRMMESLSYFLMLVKSKLYFSNTEYRGILLEMCIFLFSINCFNLIQITWPILGTILFFTFKDLEFSACFYLFLLLEHFGVS